MTLARRTRKYRCPTFLERVLFGIDCIGFCAVDETTEDPDKWLASCQAFCVPDLPHALEATQPKSLPPRR